MKHLCLLTLSLVCTCTFGQQSVHTSGGDVSSSQGSVSFSVGQISVNYIESGAAINEGVQQPYEFFNVLSMEKMDEMTFLEIFPNPTNGTLFLYSKDPIDAEIEMFDESGRLIISEQRKNIQQSQIDLTPFARGVYTIKVNGNSSVQIVRIIKN